ncbi:MAG: D-2-hydroxyacid dehydrogenase [Clostridia bacterium]|nr:D-2-hydroxyacid dehydrogenase [Clostridia bacterium]
MPRTVVAVVPWMDADLRERICRCAAEWGFEAAFFETEADALSRAREAEILFGMTPGLLAEAKCLRWLCVPFAGIDSLKGRVPEGVLLSNGAGAYGVTISEHVIMVLLMLMRGEMDVFRRIEQRIWRRGQSMDTLYGKRVLILGTGDIGRNMAARLAVFGVCSIAGVNRTGHAAPGFDRVAALSDADSLFAEADVVINCLPGTQETENAVSEKRIALLPRGAYFVNVGRGITVDETALARALAEGRLSGAALDVARKEPPEAESPLWAAPNLLLTPHCAGDMTARVTRQRCAEMFMQDLENYAKGRPLAHAADPVRGY